MMNKFDRDWGDLLRRLHGARDLGLLLGGEIPTFFEPSDLEISRVLDQVSLFENVTVTLSELLQEARVFNIRSFRCYRYLVDTMAAGPTSGRPDERFVSLAGAGNSVELTKALSLGEVDHSLSQTPLSKFHSFWCIDLGLPTLCHLDSQQSSAGVTVQNLRGLPQITFRDDCCNGVFGDRDGETWIEIPLLKSPGEPIGKLSCSFDNSEIGPGQILTKRGKRFLQSCVGAVGPLITA